MQCPVQTGNPEVLLDYCSRKLRPELVDLLEQHIRNCPECSGVAEAQKQVWSALDAWTPKPVSADFDRRLYTRIDAAVHRGLWTRLAGDGFSWKPALPFPAICATAVLAFVLVYPPAQWEAPQAPQPTRVESLEPEQVERTLEDIEMLRQLTAPPAPASARSL